MREKNRELFHYIVVHLFPSYNHLCILIVALSLFVCINVDLKKKIKKSCDRWDKGMRKSIICRLSAPSETQEAGGDSLVAHLPTSDPDVLRRFFEWRSMRHRKQCAIEEWCISGRFWRI